MIWGLNLQTDYAFKRLYGTVENKPILIRFLNALLKGHLVVKDVVYHDKERLPDSEGGKRVVYDVYCTSDIKGSGMTRKIDSEDLEDEFPEEKGTEHYFVVEMQNIYAPPFEERMIYYSCSMITDQGKAGWTYNLNPVITIAITDFDIPGMSKKLVRDIQLADPETGEKLTNKYHLIFVSLKQVPKTWEACGTELEQILYLIKNMETMTTDSAPYKDGRYMDMFKAARSNNLKDDEVILYSQSLSKLRDTELGIQYAADSALARGRAEGRAEGRLATLKESVCKMFSRKLSESQIADFLGLGIDEVKSLLSN